MTKYAQNRTDLAVISALRYKLENLSRELRQIDPDEDRQVDEDYKVAEHHSFSLAELEDLMYLGNALEQQVQEVISSAGKPQGTVEDIEVFGNRYKYQRDTDSWLFFQERISCSLIPIRDGGVQHFRAKLRIRTDGPASLELEDSRSPGHTTPEHAVMEMVEGLQSLIDIIEPPTRNRHLAMVTEAHKLCSFLANTEDDLLEVEHLIDPLDQLADKYSEKFLPNLPRDDYHKAILNLAAEQARHVCTRMHKAIES